MTFRKLTDTLSDLFLIAGGACGAFTIISILSHYTFTGEKLSTIWEIERMFSGALLLFVIGLVFAALTQIAKSLGK